MAWKQNYYDAALASGIPHGTAVYIAQHAKDPGAALIHAQGVHSKQPAAPSSAAAPKPKAPAAPKPTQKAYKPPVQTKTTIASVGATVGTPKKERAKRRMSDLRIRRKKPSKMAIGLGSSTGTGLNTPLV